VGGKRVATKGHGANRADRRWSGGIWGEQTKPPGELSGAAPAVRSQEDGTPHVIEDDGLERYRIISTLGTGGMATVLLAEDLRLGRKVALKRLAGAGDPLGHEHGRESNRALLSRLRREALLGASVSHPNLVSIYDIVSAGDGGLGIVMEYVPGETLRDRMLREGRLPADVALPILQGIAGGLDAIHRRGIVHRDLKPANVLLGDDGTVKLADFGIATGAENTRITSQGAVVGTFRYMAPEQLEDAPSNPAMDIYALAVVALEMLSGQKARPESHPIALAHALATQPPPDLRNAWPEAPAPVAELLKRGMARDPSLRPRRAGELVGRLRAALVDETTKHPVESRLARRAAAQRAATREAATSEPEPPWSRAAAAADGVVERPPAPAPRREPPRVAPPPAAHTSSAPTTDQVPRRAASGSSPVAAARRPREDWPPRHARAAGVGRRRLAAPIAILAVLVAGVAAVVIATSGPGPSAPSGGSSAGTSGTRPKEHGPSADNTAASAKKHAPSASETAASAKKHAPSASKTASTTNKTSSGSDTSTAAASGTTVTPAALGSSSAATASTPVEAVESFYHLAAAHQYARAWSLADPNFRQQLEGYQSFQMGQADDRSITFNKAAVTSQTASAATVSVETTSRRSDGTEICAGNVDLVKNGASWQLDQIGINCR
jgi:eukaryotic-like serine/threonine-protein kinase